ncbi:protein PYRICULARIA ORYZAE RESISTANCE 21 [Fagus crenata]
MGEKKTTLMVLKADLQCCRCYKKVKKVLCKFPRESLFLSLISLKQKIICKGGGTITCIEIKEPEKPKDEKPKDEKPKDEKPKDEKPKDEKLRMKSLRMKNLSLFLPLALPKVPVPIYPSGFGACCEECLRVVVEVHAIMVMVGLGHSHVMGLQCMIAMVVAIEVVMPGNLNTIVKKVPGCTIM